MPKITIEVSDTVYRLLEVLTKGEYAPKSVKDVLATLVDHAQQGVYRPGAWEREWLERAFPEGWQEHLESGDPYGRPDSPMFQRPAKESPMQLFRRRELTDFWTLVLCDAHSKQHGAYLVKHGFRDEGYGSSKYRTCTFCLSGERVIAEIEACTCAVSVPSACPVHKNSR